MIFCDVIESCCVWVDVIGACGEGAMDTLCDDVTGGSACVDVSNGAVVVTGIFRCAAEIDTR